MTKAKIFVTGGSGKAGKHLIPYLLEKDYSVVNADLVPLVMDGVDNINFNGTSGDLTVNTSDGTTHTANIGAFIDSKISALIGNAPASMDTLAEIADSLGDDPDYATNLNIQAMNTAASIIDLQDKYITEHV